MIQKIKSIFKDGHRQLLIAGIVAGYMVMTISLTLAFISKGFDISRHANSQLVLGEYGWLQTANFIIFGLLVAISALGVRYATKGKPGGVWAPILVAIYGIGGFIVGLAPTDPAFGFPLGSSATFEGFGAMSQSAQIHGIAGSIGFTAMALAGFVLARYFGSLKQYIWMTLSLLVGLSVIIVTGYLAVSAGSKITSFNYVPVWIVGSFLWLYVSLVSWKLFKASRQMR